MQTVAQSIEIVSYVTATPRSRVNQLARALVSAGIFPKSSGRDVKKIDGGQVIGLIAAVAYAVNVADAPSVASTFMALPMRDSDGLNLASVTLAKAFADSMAYPEWEGGELHLSHVATGFAAMHYGDLVVGDQLVSGELPFWTERSMGGWIKRSFIIDRSGVEILRNLFCRPDIDGMSFSSGSKPR